MGNGRLNTDYGEGRYQIIIKYLKTAGRGNISLLVWSQISAHQNQENMDTYMHSYTCRNHI